MGTGVAVTRAGNVVVVGSTTSSDLPTTTGARQGTLGGGVDGFVAIFSSDGALRSLSYLGGISGDSLTCAVGLEGGGFLVAGTTVGVDIPGIASSDTIGRCAGRNALLVRFDDAGDLVWGRYIGGRAGDAIFACAERAGRIAITGETASTDFPTSAGAQRPGFAGEYTDPFVMLLDLDARPVWSTCLGGSSDDEGKGIDIDDQGNVVVTGRTIGPDFPVTDSTFHPGAWSPYYDLFITSFDAQGNLRWSLRPGKQWWDEPGALAIGGGGVIYVVGETEGTFPTTPNALQPVDAGINDAIVMKIDRDGRLLYSSHLGGTHLDEAKGVCLLSDGRVAVTGFTVSSDYPTTPDAYIATSTAVNATFITLFDMSAVVADVAVAAGTSADELQARYDRTTGTLELDAPGGIDHRSLRLVSVDGRSVALSMGELVMMSGGRRMLFQVGPLPGGLWLIGDAQGRSARFLVGP